MKSILFPLVLMAWIPVMGQVSLSDTTQKTNEDSHLRAVPEIPIIVHDDENQDSINPIEENRKYRHFPHFWSYFQIGIIHYDQDKNINNEFNRQLSIDLGYCYTFFQKSLLGPTLFFEPFSRFRKFNFANGPDNLSPDSSAHDREWLKIYSLAAGVSNRFILSVKNEYSVNPGLWLEVGAGACLPYYSAYGIIDKGGLEGKIVKQVFPGLRPYPWLFGRFRLGYGLLAVFAEYRFIGAFESSSIFRNFPRFNFGISIAGGNK